MKALKRVFHATPAAAVLLLLASVCAAAPVRVVEFEQGPYLERYRIKDMVTVHPGDTYSPELLERDRRLLESTGLFRRVETEAEQREDGWRIVIRVAPYELVQDVALSGNFLVLRKELSRALRLRPGDRFSEEQVRQDVAALMKIYGDRGFRETLIRTEIEKGRKGVSVAYRIREGKPGVVRKVEFAGNASIPEKELRPLLRLAQLGFFDQEQIVQSVERLEEHYRDRGYFHVDVTPGITRGEGVVPPVLNIVDPVKALATLLPGQYEVVDVTFRIEEGERYTVEFTGQESYAEEDLVPLLTFSRTGFFDDHEAETGRRRLLEFYRERGFFRVEIDLNHDPSERRSVYTIREGRRFTVGSVVLQGVEFFGTEGLRSKLETWKTDEVGLRFLRQDELNRDVEKILDEYRSEGFLHAEVSPPLVTLDASPEGAEVQFTVKEGKRFLIGSILFEGALAVEEDALRGVLKSRQGTPYRPGWVMRDKEKILALIGAEGYPGCRVRERVVFVEEGLVDLHYIVDQGRRRVVGRVLVVGARKTKDRVVLREFPLSAGDPFSFGAVVEGKRNLYGLGYFQEVRLIAPEPVGEDMPQDLVISVRERPTGQVKVGAGFNSEERYGGFIEVGEQNLFGKGRGASLRIKVSTITRRYDFFLREPWPFGYQINSEANLFEEFREEKGYDTVRRGVNVGVKRDFLEDFTLTLRYRFEFVDYENVEFTFDDPAEAVEEIESLERLNISSGIALLTLDRRDDPVTPRKGFHHLAGVEVATPLLGGDTTFNKYTLESSWFIPVTERSEIALGFRGGFAQTLGGFDNLPLAERFFLGGARGVRGWPEDEVGPKDAAGNPLGGDAFALGIAEYRFAIGKKRWRGVVFFDIGNVWANLDTIAPTEAKAGLGVGIRYETLVGPIRLDYGIKLNPDEGESPGRLYFNIGFPI